MGIPTKSSDAKGRINRRQGARLAAVQALFQWSKSDDTPDEVVRQFRDERLGTNVDDLRFPAADEDFFADLVGGVAARAQEIDRLIGGALADGWSLERLDPLVLQILRAGTYELLARPDVPTAVAISEYVDVAHAFYNAAEPRFVNGLLDRLAKDMGR